LTVLNDSILGEEELLLPDVKILTLFPLDEKASAIRAAYFSNPPQF
jgi:hypothetical protein